MILSILIPTIPERNLMFKKLLREVKRQAAKCHNLHPTLGNIEVLFYNSKKFTQGGLSIGKKRQVLLNRSIGEYVCFLDDDESISPDYVETLVRLCFEGKDVCTFNNISKFDNYWCVVRLSLHNIYNEQARPGIIKRRPWHICPVKSEFAKSVEFLESNYGEDWVWFEQVLKLCKSESHTEAIIHQYNHSLKVSQSDNVTTAI